MKNLKDIIKQIKKEYKNEDIDFIVIFEKDKYKLGDRVSIGKYDLEVVNKIEMIKVL